MSSMYHWGSRQLQDQFDSQRIAAATPLLSQSGSTWKSFAMLYQILAGQTPNLSVVELTNVSFDAPMGSLAGLAPPRRQGHQVSEFVNSLKV